MLKALELENFKAFGERNRIEFAPITLIYGQNSAGKSSILNALNLLKQTRMSREQGALLLPRAEGGLVDLGSFHELLHDHDLSRTLAMRVDFGGSMRGRRRQDEDGATPIGFEVGFHRRDNHRDVTLAYLQAYAGSAIPVMRFEPYEITEKEMRTLSLPAYAFWQRNQRLSSRDLQGASCVRISDDREFWRSTYAEAYAVRREIVRALEALRDDVLGKSKNQMSLFRGDPTTADFESAISFYSSDFSLESFISRRIKAETGAIVAMDGFLPMPTRVGGNAEHVESFALRYLRESRVRTRGLFDATEFIVDAGRQLEVVLDRLFPLGPFRRAPKRLYIFTGTTPRDVGYSGDLLPDLLFRQRKLVVEANQWLDRLDIGYHIEIAPVGTPSNDLFEVRLRDTRRGGQTSIALPDVGFGISQILPFIVQSLASEEQIITIEQPEVHIHPKLQADLGDLLIACIQEPRRHQFIIETHSEHLVLRLLRRIRETATDQLAHGQLPLRPDQLSVVYLERGDAGARVHHLRVDESGEFIDRWPQGFFEERALELF